VCTMGLLQCVATIAMGVGKAVSLYQRGSFFDHAKILMACLRDASCIMSDSNVDAGGSAIFPLPVGTVPLILPLFGVSTLDVIAEASEQLPRSFQAMMRAHIKDCKLVGAKGPAREGKPLRRVSVS
jgi:hypothetical protein